MRARRLMARLTLAALVPASLATGVLSAATLTGRIAWLDAANRRVQLDDGGKISQFGVGNNTLTLDGQITSFGALQVGFTATATYDGSFCGKGVLCASRLDARSALVGTTNTTVSRFAGQITQIDLTYSRLTASDGTTATTFRTGDAAITLDGAASKLSYLKVGLQASIEHNACATLTKERCATHVAASSATTSTKTDGGGSTTTSGPAPTAPTGSGSPDGSDTTQTKTTTGSPIQGTISAVGATALTLDYVDAAGIKTRKTFYFASSTAVTLNGQPITPKGLLVGMAATVTPDGADPRYAAAVAATS